MPVRRMALAIILALACASCTASSPAGPAFFLGAPSTTYTSSIADSTRGNGGATVTLATVPGITSGSVDLTLTSRSVD